MFRHPKKFTLQSLSAFIYELSHLLHSGLPLLTALHLIERHSLKNQDAVLSANLQKKLTGGSNFANAWAHITQETFSSAMLYAAESTGLLADMLSQIHHYALQQKAFHQLFWQAIRYPLFLITITISLLIALCNFIIPQFAELYASFSLPLPLFTQKIIEASLWFNRNKALLGLLCLTGSLSIYCLRCLQIRFVKQYTDKILYQLPFYRHFQEMRFWHAIGLMLKAGLPMVSALQTCLPLLCNEVMSHQMQQLIQQITQGQTPSQVLQKQPKKSVKLVAVLAFAEASGNFQELLNHYTEEERKQLQWRTSQLKTWLEPLFLCLVGILITFVLIALYLPMIQLGEHI